MEKVWNDQDNVYKLRPSEITIVLKANGDKTDKTMTLSEENSWKATFEGLDKYKDGKLIAYSIVEVETDHYSSIITGDVDNGFTVTNTLITGDLVITKTSMGTKTPQNAIFTITGPNDFTKEVKYSEFTNGQYVLEGLPLGEYKVVESNANVKGYKLTVTGNESIANVNNDEMSQIDIVNNYVSDKKASLIIYKVDQDGNFLEGANFQMVREDGEIINPIKDRARFEFKDLIDGTYTVKETTTPEGYEGIGEFTIVIEKGLITCPQYGLTDPFVTLSVENTNDGTSTDVVGDEIDDDDFFPEVKGDETDNTVKTSDDSQITEFAGLSLLSAMMFFFLRKKKQVNN